MTPRDYRLNGTEGARAEQAGLASATWYASAIPRKRLKELMQRRNGPAIRDTLIWLGALIATGAWGYHAWGTWWAVPAFAAYGVLYGSACDSRWHECGHGTAFKTPWMNDVVYHLARFMVLRESTSWRWSHARHHTDTIIVGRDPEIAVPRPANLRNILLNFVYLPGGYSELRKTVIHATGRLPAGEETYIPEGERKSVCFTARIYVLIYLAFIAWAVAIRSFLPLMYVLLPSFYGAWLMIVFGLTQHAGLAEDVLDHRLNCRTVYMNPVLRFLYWNMNYHVEHHMYPMVPYHALPALHAELKADLPKPYPGLWAAYREIIPALLRQRKDPGYFVKRELPPSAPAMSLDAASVGQAG
ncbi:MAG: putative oxidoreductase [Verrucomicrobia bacterium]|nr:putative oxidoreductase [Verrucomicrobiota bacterium]